MSVDKMDGTDPQDQIMQQLMQAQVLRGGGSQQGQSKAAGIGKDIGGGLSSLLGIGGGGSSNGLTPDANGLFPVPNF